MQNDEVLEDLYIRLVKAKLRKHWKALLGILVLFTGASAFASFLIPPRYSMTYGLIIGNYLYRSNAALLIESTAKIRDRLHSSDGFLVKEVPPYLEISVLGTSEDDVRLKSKNVVDNLVNQQNAILEKKKEEGLIVKQIKQLKKDLAKEEEEVTKISGRFTADSVERAMYTIHIRDYHNKATERLDNLYSQLDLNFNPTTIEYEEGPKKLSPSTAQSATIGFLFGILASIFFLYFKKDPDITASLMNKAD